MKAFDAFADKQRPSWRWLPIVPLFCAGCQTAQSAREPETAKPPALAAAAAQPVTVTAKASEPSTMSTRELDAGYTKALNEAAAGVESAALRELLRRHWARQLENDPIGATRLGVHAFDHLVEDNSRAGLDRLRASRAELIQAARALDERTLQSADVLTRRMLLDQLESDEAKETCQFEKWNISPQTSPLVRWNRLPAVTKVDTEQAGRQLVARYRSIPQHIDNDISSLHEGVKLQLFANAESATRVVVEIEKQLDTPPEDWPMAAPAKEAHPHWAPGELELFRKDLYATIREQIRPALARYVAAVRSEVLPHARDAGNAGVSALPFGKACYDGLLRHYTSLPLSADEIHRRGLEDMQKTRAAMLRHMQRALGVKDVSRGLEKLRADRQLYFESQAEITPACQSAVEEIKRLLPSQFGALALLPLTVEALPAHEAGFASRGRYQPPSPDGKFPARFQINIAEPRAWPKYQLRALVAHEALPGHHLQQSIAEAAENVPAFRKYTYWVPYIEGWGLYAEALADEMGFYRNSLEQLGRLSFEAWRVARLVVDTGLHSLGWSRAQAERYLFENTALEASEIRREVDRYIVLPGQAVAYRIGQARFLELRERARKELGVRYDQREFHAAVLDAGPVTLPGLEYLVTRYIAEKRRSQEGHP